MSAAKTQRALVGALAAATLVILTAVGSAGGASKDRDTQPPTSPLNIRVTSATTSAISLAWDASTDDVEVVSYAVTGDLRASTEDRDKRKGLRDTELVTEGLSCGKSFTIWLEAVDRAGNRSVPTKATVATAPCVDATPPTTPSGFRQAATSADAVVLAWDAATDEQGVVGYGIYRAGLAVASTGEASYTLTKLSCGSVYELQVDAYDAAGNRSQRGTVWVRSGACATAAPSPAPAPAPAPAPSPTTTTQKIATGSPSGSATTTAPAPSTADAAAPSAPSSLNVAMSTKGKVRLDWRPASDNVGIKGYGVYRDSALVSTVTQSAASVSGLACGTTYDFAVDAVDDAGNRSGKTTVQGSTSACSGSTTPPATPPADTSAPSQPSSLSVSSASQTSVALTWPLSSDNVGVSGYGVYRGSSLVSSVPSPGATVSNLQCGTTYSFAVDAYDAAGNRSGKATVQGSTSACSAPLPPADTSAPSQPSSLAISSATQTGVALTWGLSSDNVGVSGYGVYRGSSLVSSVPRPDASVSSLQCGTAYSFAVDAYDAAGNRSGKSSVTGTTAACSDTQAPSAPANVVASSRTGTSIALSWSGSADNVGVVGYGLYRGGVLVGTSATTGGIFASLTCNTNYTLAVDAYDGAGNRSAKTTVMVSTTACPDTTPPSAPTALAASEVTQTGFKLGWTASSDNAGVAGYDVYRQNAKTGTTTATSYAFTSLACGTSVAVGVVAFDAAGNRSTQSNTTASTSSCSTSSTWTFCSNESTQCAFTGTKEVRYGKDTTWTTPRQFTDGVFCSNQVFGDPLPWTVKECQVRNLSSTPTPPPPPTGSVTYPASYYAGPLGTRNPLPARKGAFLLVWPSSIGCDWACIKSQVQSRQQATGRTFDGIAAAYRPGDRPEQWIHDNGSLPIVAGWTPGGSPAEIASGARDAQIIELANYLKAYNFVVMLRMFHEFDMEHLSYHACGQAFIDMWRRVVNVFKQQGATNVGFWWSPNEGYNRSCVASSYPGDAYVDWVGSDSYNWQYVSEGGWVTPLHAGWGEFGELFDYGTLSSGAKSQHDAWGPRKPFIVGETGTVYDPNYPTKKGDWFRNVVTAAKQMEYLVGVQFFDADVSSAEGAKANWKVDYNTADPSAYRGFIDLARDPYFNTR